MVKSTMILIYQETAALGENMRQTVIKKGWKPVFSHSLAETASLLSKNEFQVVIFEISGNNTSSCFQYMQLIAETYPSIYIVVVAVKPTVQDAVTATGYGAIDYISSQNISQNLPDILHEIEDKLDLRKRLQSEKVSEFQQTTGIVGKSRSLVTVLQKAQQAAKADINVLLTGESGTGKDILARAMHYQSPRVKQPFLPVNCGGIPSELIESELFGHVKGSFTGAESTQDGFFHAAEGGTLFLDEIGNTSMGMQAKLLRAIEDKEIWKIGSRQPEGVDVRIIAATNQSLENLIKEGSFREDLFYRLNVVSLNLPPLRERPSDILPLCHHFAKKYAIAHKKSLTYFTDDVLRILQTYDWPGNVRELKNLMQQLIIFLNSREITVDMLPLKMRKPLNGCSEKENTLTAVERSHIQDVCIRVNWNISQAAKILGICRRSLYRKLHKYHIGIY